MLEKAPARRASTRGPESPSTCCELRPAGRRVERDEDRAEPGAARTTRRRARRRFSAHDRDAVACDDAGRARTLPPSRATASRISANVRDGARRRCRKGRSPKAAAWRSSSAGSVRSAGGTSSIAARTYQPGQARRPARPAHASSASAASRRTISAAGSTSSNEAGRGPGVERHLADGSLVAGVRRVDEPARDLQVAVRQRPARDDLHRPVDRPHPRLRLALPRLGRRRSGARARGGPASRSRRCRSATESSAARRDDARACRRHARPTRARRRGACRAGRRRRRARARRRGRGRPRCRRRRAPAVSPAASTTCGTSAKVGTIPVWPPESDALGDHDVDAGRGRPPPPRRRSRSGGRPARRRRGRARRHGSGIAEAGGEHLDALGEDRLDGLERLELRGSR